MPKKPALSSRARVVIRKLPAKLEVIERIKKFQGKQLIATFLTTDDYPEREATTLDTRKLTGVGREVYDYCLQEGYNPRLTRIAPPGTDPKATGIAILVDPKEE